MELNQKEILRYLGYRGNAADEQVLAQIEKAAKALDAFTPRTVHKRLPCAVLDKNAVTIGDVRIRSKNLARHLKGCHEVFLMAATLGVQADTCIQRASVVDMSYAVVLQAACAAGIEWVCDTLEVTLLEQARADGLYLRPRFSPGYGDFPIEHQKDMIRLLDCSRRIGLTVTDSLMMVPTKSVTAVIGLTGDGSGCHTVKCAACNQKDCPFRKV